MADLVADAAERTGEGTWKRSTSSRPGAVTWNDGSLGCPEPGMFYTQALVDGYHVILQAGDEELDYRVSAAWAAWKVTRAAGVLQADARPRPAISPTSSRTATSAEMPDSSRVGTYSVMTAPASRGPIPPSSAKASG